MTMGLYAPYDALLEDLKEALTKCDMDTEGEAGCCLGSAAPLHPKGSLTFRGKETCK